MKQKFAFVIIFAFLFVSCQNKDRIPSAPTIKEGVYIVQNAVEESEEDDKEEANAIIDPYSVPGLYPSNSIGQIRDESTDGYTINVIAEGQYFLLKNNVIVKRVQINYEGSGRRTRRETDANGNFISLSRYDKNGNLIEHVYKDRSYDILNFDNRNRLISVKSFSANGEEKRNCVYFRDSKSGNVLGINDNGKYSFFSSRSNSDIMITGDEKSYDIYETFFGTVTFKSSSTDDNDSYDVTNTEEGNLIITRNGKQTIYSSDGRIIEDNGIKYYYKKDGTLDYTQEEKNQLTIKEYYEDAALKRREEYEKEIPIRTIVYKKETIETTFYENGIKYATITYAGDGYKVLNIQYHNEKK